MAGEPNLKEDIAELGDLICMGPGDIKEDE